MSAWVAYLPDGNLGKWTLFISAVSFFNSIQCYLGDLRLSRRIYTGAPNQVTPLSNRTFGTWTAAVAIVRMYAAYHLDDPVVWRISLSTYLLAGFHFLSEWLVFGTAKFGAGLLGPLVVASVTPVWMWNNQPLLL